jgi:intein/homing endonuclease
MNTLKRNNIPRRTTQHYTVKYITNEKFFDIINDEEKAYFLGLMYADGNNYVRIPHSYEVSIKLQEQDKYILEKFRDLLSPQTNLKLIIDKKIKTKYCLFKINSKILSHQLSELGCVPAKSLILEFPKFISNNLIHHFIRGYSDGDGSIYSKSPTKTDYINYGWQITSTNKFTSFLKMII